MLHWAMHLGQNQVVQFLIACQQCVDEEDWIIIDLIICKSRSMSRNQLHKLNMPSNAHNFANKLRNWTKLTTKRSEISTTLQSYISKQYDKYLVQNA